MGRNYQPCSSGIPTQPEIRNTQYLVSVRSRIRGTPYSCRSSSFPGCKDRRRLHSLPLPNHGSRCARCECLHLWQAYHFPPSHQGHTNFRISPTRLFNPGVNLMNARLRILTFSTIITSLTALSSLHLYILLWTRRKPLPNTAHSPLRFLTAIIESISPAQALLLNLPAAFN